MTAIFRPEGPLFRATEQAGGPWSPDMLQGSATTALMTREVERLADASGFAVRRLTFDLWRPAGLRAFGLADRNAARRPQGQDHAGAADRRRCRDRPLHGAVDGARQRVRPPIRSRRHAGDDAAPETGSPPPAFAQKWSRYFQNVSVRLIEGALEKPGPAAAWMRLDVPMVEGEANTPLLQAVQAADFSSGVGQIVDMREWTFINPEISLYFFRPPEGDWILIRSRTRAGANGAGLTMATLSDRKGAFAEVLQAMTFERRAHQAS